MAKDPGVQERVSRAIAHLGRDSASCALVEITEARKNAKNGTMLAYQLDEAAAVLKEGTRYAKQHLPAILRAGLSQTEVADEKAM